jgi:hypothetical protein
MGRLIGKRWVFTLRSVEACAQGFYADRIIESTGSTYPLRKSS